MHFPMMFWSSREIRHITKALFLCSMMDKKFSEHSKLKKEEDMLENCSICCPDSALVQSSPVQFSCSVMSDSLQPHELQHTRPPCPSPTPRVYQNSCALSRWCHPAISSSVIPFSSCPQSLPASGSFPMSQLFAWGGQSIGVSASASVQFSSSTANMSCDRKLNIRFNLSSRSLGTHWRDNRQCDLSGRDCYVAGSVLIGQGHIGLATWFAILAVMCSRCGRTLIFTSTGWTVWQSQCTWVWANSRR